MSRTPRLILATAVVAGCLAGCGGSPSHARRAATPAPPATATPSAAAPMPRFRVVRFRATDGVRLRGRLTAVRARRAPTVVLVHQSDGGPDQWNDFVRVLHAHGLATFAYTSRGSGELDETLLARDVAGALRVLPGQRGVDGRRLAVVGASIGATATSWFAGTPAARDVRAFVALSPAPWVRPPHPYRPHDLLIMADRAELGDAKDVASFSRSGRTLRQAPIIGHGVDLLPDRRVRATVLHWLDARLGSGRSS